MLRKTAVFLVLLFFVHTVSGITASATLFEPFRDLEAASAILVERDSGIFLYENNIHVSHPADALATVMTLLLASRAVENDEISDNELIIMTEAAWDGLDLESTAAHNILPGEEITFIDLMYSAFVGSSIEASNMIALRMAGSIDAFVMMMNAKALEIGTSNTRFANASGLYHESQVTTAHDQYLIFNEAMGSSLFTEVASTFRHITESNEEFESRTITSSNSLINPSSRYYYRYAIAGRDSATYEGGHSMVAISESNGMTLISVILGSYVRVFEDESTDILSFTETSRLMQWGSTEFSWRDILKTTDLLARVPVMHGAGADFVNARPAESLTLLLNNGINLESYIKTVTLRYDEDNPLAAPVSVGYKLGEVVITHNNTELATIDLVANTNVELNPFEYVRRQVLDLLTTDTARNIIVVLALLILVYIALVIRYNIIRARRLHRIRKAKSDIIKERHQNFRDF